MLLTSSLALDSLILLVILFFLLYKYYTRTFDYWKKRGVYNPKPLPFFGNFLQVFLCRTTIQEHLKKFYDQTDDPYFGIFIVDEPVLVLKSPKLVKEVLIKNFDVFCDRRVATPKHPKMANCLFFLKFVPWKKMRTKLSSLFTASMLRIMHTQLEKINQIVIDYLNKNAGVIDTRFISGHYSSEMIVRCFYAADPHCFEEKPSLFRKYIFNIFDYNFRNAIIQNLFFIRPSLTNFLKLDFIDDDCIQFFERAFKHSMSVRENYDGKPQNFVDMTNKDIKQGATDGIDINKAVANAILFLIAGQETPSIVLSYSLYELAMNQEVQNKLRSHIQANIKEHGGLTYDGIKENKYLERCLLESMRKYPALPFLDRMPIADYRFQDTNLVVEKGTSVFIPFFSIHRDAKHFPNPEKYDPDRHLNTEYNVDGLNFIPFGEGPRRCLGKRLGYLGVSMAISNIILRFKLEKCEETPEKIEFSPNNFALVSKKGLGVKFTPLD